MFFQLSNIGLNGTSRLYIYRTLYNSFELAVKRKELQYNFCNMIEPPKKDKFTANIITENQFKKLLSFLIDYDIRYSLPILLGLLLGLRRGEILGLKWTDIDFVNSVLHIQRTATPRKGGYIFTDCKTEQSNRYLQLQPFLVDKFKEWNLIQCKNCSTPIDFVFSHSNNKLFSATTINRKYKFALKSCDIDVNTRFHDLRHSFATYLVNDNVPISVISQMLGHSKISTTLDIYTHADIKQQSIALKSLEKITEKA